MQQKQKKHPSAQLCQTLMSDGSDQSDDDYIERLIRQSGNKALQRTSREESYNDSITNINELNMIRETSKEQEEDTQCRDSLLPDLSSGLSIKETVVQNKDEDDPGKRLDELEDNYVDLISEAHKDGQNGGESADKKN